MGVKKCPNLHDVIYERFLIIIQHDYNLIICTDVLCRVDWIVGVSLEQFEVEVQR